jgi:hypothetical protein
MKTYAETKKKPKFNWYDFLNRAIKGNITESEVADAQDDANNWVTCACGNQCSIIPRDEDGEPWDNTLSDLGSDFSYEIDDCKWKDALKILNKIEKRSALLINKEIKKMSKALEDNGYKVTKVK